MEEDRANILRAMQICRFCLSDTGHLTNIHVKDGKQAVPLPLQIMACVAIEVFANDGMPQLICDNCRRNTTMAYNFKTTCKKSDDALKLFLATGALVKPAFTHLNVPIEESSQYVKRGNPDGNSFSKRFKSDSSDVGSNHSQSVKISQIGTNKKAEQKFTMETDNDDDSQEENPDDAEYANESEEEEEEEEKINAVLKVPQVKTDVFPCSYCERSFPLKQLLDLHMINHKRDRSFECEECGRKFFTKYDLGKHIQTHSDNKPFACVICKKQFSREALLHRHQKVHVDAPKYLCSHCDRTFLTREELDVHSEKHKKKRPFTCRICNKSFVFKQGLERHEVTHSHEKPHKCNYCEASFTSPIKLTRHITSHAGLRPYPCKRCGRTFLLSHHLTRHMRSHYAAKSNSASPIGQHKCDVCSMSFRRKDSLINHSAIHSMVNLRCVICNTAFESAQMVKDHITTHLSGLPYPCDKCDYSFETQDQLEEHEVKHAEMEYEEQIEREVSQEAQMEDEGGEEEDEEDSGDDIAEFTITNDIDNPQIIRRSKREPKIKNYAQFLKQELGSDDEEGHNDDTSEDVVQSLSKSVSEEETIKPIIRTEGTKVYTRKNTTIRTKTIAPVSSPQVKPASPENIDQPHITNLENLGLSKEAVQALSHKQFVDMKIGDKTVRVQKLMMTKAEIDAMAREGKIEFSGNRILLKKSVAKVEKIAPPPTIKHISIESIIDEPKLHTIPKPQVKKTYQRKSMGVADENNDVQETPSSEEKSETNTEQQEHEGTPEVS